MAILPLGTANNIAASLGIRRDTRQLVERLEQARPVPFDLGRARCGAHSWTVVEGIGAGLIPTGMATAERVLGGSSRDVHPVAEVSTAVEVFYDVLKTLDPVELTITIDGLQLSGAFLLVEVLNIPSVGPNLVLAPGANPSDRLFDVVIAEPQHLSELLSYLESRIHGKGNGLSLRRYRARHVRIESCAELHVDDRRIDTCGIGEIEVTMQGASATVLVERRRQPRHALKP
jgi:diacylglycerol kinase family enzyme